MTALLFIAARTMVRAVWLRAQSRAACWVAVAMAAAYMGTLVRFGVGGCERRRSIDDVTVPNGVSPGIPRAGGHRWGVLPANKFTARPRGGRRQGRHASGRSPECRRRAWRSASGGQPPPSD